MPGWLLALLIAAAVPREVLLEAWPGNPNLLNRLLGPARRQEPPAQPSR